MQNFRIVIDNKFLYICAFETHLFNFLTIERVSLKSYRNTNLYILFKNIIILKNYQVENAVILGLKIEYLFGDIDFSVQV